MNFALIIIGLILSIISLFGGLVLLDMKSENKWVNSIGLTLVIIGFIGAIVFGGILDKVRFVVS